MRSNSPAHAEGVLSPAVVVWRAAHGLIATGFLAAIGYVWWCALTGRRGRLLQPAIAALAGEGVLVVANRGDCPPIEVRETCQPESSPTGAVSTSVDSPRVVAGDHGFSLERAREAWRAQTTTGGPQLRTR